MKKFIFARVGAAFLLGLLLYSVAGYLLLRYSEMDFRVVLCLLGGISSSWVGVLLRNFKVRQEPPASRAHLSMKERQQKIRVASWITFGMTFLYTVAVVVFAWLKKGR
jgi:uncharacterized membrane protein YhdT